MWHCSSNSCLLPAAPSYFQLLPPAHCYYCFFFSGQFSYHYNCLFQGKSSTTRCRYRQWRRRWPTSSSPADAVQPPYLADYLPDVADAARADIVSSLAANADQTLRQLPINHRDVNWLASAIWPVEPSDRQQITWPHIWTSNLFIIQTHCCRELYESRVYACDLKQEFPSKNYFVIFCPIKIGSFNLLSLAFIFSALAVVISFKRLRDRHIHWPHNKFSLRVWRLSSRYLISMILINTNGKQIQGFYLAGEKIDR